MKPDLDRMIADLTAMVRIPSVNPYDEPAAPGLREAEMADWLEAAMLEIGLEVERAEVSSGRPNVWGRLRGSGGGQVLMLAGHTDTVGVAGYDGDPFSAEIRDGRLHGRGSVDMKGPLAAMLETARLAKSAALAGDLVLMFVVDEEHLMIGSLIAGQSGPKADACIVCEPSMLAVAPAHKGQSAFAIEIEGRAVHSSRPELGDNAIVGAARLIEAVLRYNDELQTRLPHPLLGHARATPVLISGGESHSAVPGKAVLTVDRRTLPGEDAAVIRAELEAVIASAGIRATLGEPSPHVPGLDTPIGAPLAKAALAAAAAVGAPTAPVAFPGGTDAPNFGCPAVICGPGDLAQAHTANEYIALEQLEKAAVLYLKISEDLLGRKP
jgi:acetylornithine deacetylase